MGYLLVRIGVEFGAEAVRQEHCRVIIFETAKHLIKKLLRGVGAINLRHRIAIDQLLGLIASRGLFEFCENVHY